MRRQKQQQIPFGNDRKKGQGKSNYNCKSNYNSQYGGPFASLRMMTKNKQRQYCNG